jgi:hypothetical protein
VGGKGNIVVDPGSYLKAGGFSLMSNVTINGGSTVESRLELMAPGASDTDRITVNNLGSLTIPASHVVETRDLAVTTFGEFYKDGPGTLRITGTGGVDLASTALFNITAGSVVIDGTKAPTDSALAQIYVDDASLVVNGSISGDINVGQFDPNGVLGGRGMVGNVLITEGLLTPGDPTLAAGIGTLSTGNLTLDSLSIFNAQVDGAGQSDRVSVTGTVNLNADELRLTLTNPELLLQGDVFTLIHNDDIDAIGTSFGFGFANAAINPEYSSQYATVFDTSGNPWLLSLSGEGGAFDVSGGNDLAIMAVVPEPSVLTSLAGGMALLFGGLRRRRKSISATTRSIL